MSRKSAGAAGSHDRRHSSDTARGNRSVRGSIRGSFELALKLTITLAFIAGLLVDPGASASASAAQDVEFMTAATAPSPDAPLPSELSQGELNSAVATARAEWEAAVPGIDLSGVSASIVDLPDLVLGSASGNSIQIDVSAAGHGWGAMSLITVVRHEMGHVAGEGHSSGGLMDEYLSVGESHSGPAPAPVPEPVVETVDPVATNVESPVTDPIVDPAVTDPTVTDPATVDPVVDPTDGRPVGDRSGVG